MSHPPRAFRLVVVLETDVAPEAVQQQWREVARDAHGIVLRERSGALPNRPNERGPWLPEEPRGSTVGGASGDPRP